MSAHAISTSSYENEEQIDEALEINQNENDPMTPNGQDEPASNNETATQERPSIVDEVSRQVFRQT
jgi:hypothetical protein